MEQTPKDYSRQIEQINAALTKERASVDTLRNELGAAKTKIDELNHSVYKWWTTANQLEHTLAAVYKSGSWRVTWPLRKLMYYVKRLFPHFSGLKERPAHVGNTSRDFPSTLHKRLFVDISELSRHDAGTGVQRVVRSMLGELLKNPPTGYQVEPVYATAGSKGYYYAGKYISRLLGHHDTTVSDEPLCPRRGDVFLGLDLQHHVAIAQADYFKRLKCLNIPVYFVVYDMLPITFPQYFAKGLADLHAQWLGVISQSDGLICISETVAFEVMEWLDKHYPARKATLKITYNHI
ncbi:MAG: hypothetical protein HQK96_21715, partial [Nitrospirae bacterium]|nr:hypothetical protein [Nitrospirota bacterium]